MKTFPAGVMAIAACGLIACGPPKELEACNIATEECQADVYYALLRLRGDGYDPLAKIPPIRTLTVAQYEDELEGDRPEPPPPDDDDAGVEESEEPSVEPWDTSLQLLGLVTPSVSTGQAAIDNQVDHVAAYYASDTESVTVIDHGNERDETDGTALLLHELVHALQDRELSGESLDGTTDGLLTARTLTEGEATFYEQLGRAEMANLPPLTLDWDSFYIDSWLRNGRFALPYERSLFYGVRWFIYPLGAHYLTDAWLRAGNAGVRRAYTEPRQHMAQFMAGYGATSLARTSPLRCHITPPSDSYERSGYDRFGALEVYAFLTACGVEDQRGWPLASGWVDDLIAVYFEPDEEVVLLSWRIRFADRQSAQLALAEAELNPLVTAEVRGRDLILIGGNDPDVTAEWDGTRDCDDE